MTNFFKALELIDKNEINKVVEQEYRIYYDKQGKPTKYSTDDHDGDYIVVDLDTYVQRRFDFKIVDKEIVRKTKSKYIKLIPNIQGSKCNVTDVSIIDSNGRSWGLKEYE